MLERENEGGREEGGFLGRWGSVPYQEGMHVLYCYDTGINMLKDNSSNRYSLLFFLFFFYVWRRIVGVQRERGSGFHFPF